MPKPNDFMKQVQYPQRDYYHDERAFNDVRLAYDRIQQLEDHVRSLNEEMSKPEPKKKENPADTKIGGIRVTAGLPQSGRPVSTLSGIPVLAYNPASGEIEWTVPS